MKFKEHEQTKKEYKIGGDIWKPKNGDNRVRLLSGYEVYGFHWIGDKQTGTGGICIGKDNGCKFCGKGDKPKAKFLIWILDRTDSEVKVAQVGYTVVQQIGEYQENPEWAFEETPGYDINIKRTGQSIETKYTVQPSPNKVALTEEEQALVIDTIKPLKGIISRMKEKAGGKPDIIQVEEPEAAQADTNEIRVEDVPF